MAKQDDGAIRTLQISGAHDDRQRLASDLYQRILADLDELVASTGENKYRHAAAIVRGRTLGRKVIDDRWALKRVASFPAERRREAVGKVALHLAGPGASDKQIDAHARRLRRKLRKSNGQNTSIRRINPVHKGP